SASAFPAALQPRPQSDRAGLRQTQTPHPSGRASRCRGNLAKGRRTPRSLLQGGGRQLSQKLRVCFSIKTERSNVGNAPVRDQWRRDESHYAKSFGRWSECSRVGSGLSRRENHQRITRPLLEIRAGVIGLKAPEASPARASTAAGASG